MADFFFGFDTTVAVSKLVLTERTIGFQMFFERVDNGSMKIQDLVRSRSTAASRLNGLCKYLKLSSKLIGR